MTIVSVKAQALISRMNMASAEVTLLVAQMNYETQRYGEWLCDWPAAAGIAQEEFNRAKNELEKMGVFA